MKGQANRQSSGQAALMSVFFVMMIMLSAVFSISSLALSEHRVANEKFKSSKSFYAAEAGIDDAVYRYKNNKPIAPFSLTLNDVTADISITDIPPSRKKIKAIGDADNAKRAIDAYLSIQSGASFSFALQAGADGISMGNYSSIQGSVYSNGTVSGANGATITEDISIAGAQNYLGYWYDPDLALINAQDSGRVSPKLDIAQSFIATSTKNISQIEFLIKKCGDPPDRTVRILANKITSPNINNPTTNVLAMGTLYANQALEDTTGGCLDNDTFGWVRVSLNTTPALSPGATYWISLDNGTDANNYYVLAIAPSDNNAQVAKYSSGWSSGAGSYADFSNKDFVYRVYVGGAVNTLKSMNVLGSAYVNTIENSSKICGDAYYQIIDEESLQFLNDPTSGVCGGSSPLTTGASNPPGGTYQGDKPIQQFPISDVWVKAREKEATSTISLIYGDDPGETCPYSPLPGETILYQAIYCNMNIPNYQTNYFNSPFFVQGNINFGNSVQFNLSPASGPISGVVIADALASGATSGKIDTGNNFKACGSFGYDIATDKCVTTDSNGDHSYALLISMYSGTDSAIGVANSAKGAIFYVPYGKFEVGNNVVVNSVTAKKISLANNATLLYETGLQNVMFSPMSGSGGTWAIDSWKEVAP